MKKIVISAGLVVAMFIQGLPFCGFYVAKADANLFNQKSQVILVRDGNYSVLTMSSDFQGDVKDFAMVVPVPTVLQRHDIKTVNPNVFSKLDEYSGPRLVEYYDENPCSPKVYYDMDYSMSVQEVASMSKTPSKSIAKKEYKVTIEAEYKVDEYDILILSAKESDGLKRWLLDNGYKIPQQAEEVLEPYIKSNLKFFVVKVDAERLKASGYETLKPLQIKYESPKFMLPIRLGMANSAGDQDLIVYALTKTGRIECTNYRTVKIPTDRNIPTFVQERFGEFYVDLFNKEYNYQGKNAVFLEYAWNVSPNWGGMKCDPCVGNPPIFDDLAQAGVFWNMNAEQVFFTRLHVRYSRDKFPQDLLFQATPNRENFQGRYIMTHTATGDLTCDAGQNYLYSVVDRTKKELDELAVLTGWDTQKYNWYVQQYESRISDQKIKRGSILPIIIDDTKPNGFWKKVGFTVILISLVFFMMSVLNGWFKKNVIG
ncbi:MAG: DUF2330 domain-containing protein [Bacteroidia bacterium]